MKRNDYLYLDHAATTPMRESALEAFKNAEEFAYANSSAFLNASSALSRIGVVAA